LLTNKNCVTTLHKETVTMYYYVYTSTDLQLYTLLQVFIYFTRHTK